MLEPMPFSGTGKEVFEACVSEERNFWFNGEEWVAIVHAPSSRI